MKKRLVMILLAAMMAFGATGCSIDKETSGEMEETKEEKDDEEDEEDEEEDEEEKDSKEDKDSEEKEKDDDKEDTDDKDDEAKKPAAGMLGTDFDENYDGFEYLYCELLMTESEENKETGKMESQKLNVFIPNGDYTSVNRDTAYADELGVDFRVTLNPYIRYEQDDYTVKENMEYFLSYEYDPFYCTSYKDLVISEAEGDKTSAKACVNFCYYDEWDDTYIPVYCTYYLVELSKDMTVLVEVEIMASDVTGKTEELLAELETFYGFDIDWNEAAAQQKLDNFLANGVTDTVTCSTGYLMFEMPKGWEEDYSYGDYSNYAFAPDGDFASAGCVISISREYLGMDSFDASEIVNNEEQVKEIFKDENGEDLYDNLQVTAYGETCLGTAVKISFSATEGSLTAVSQWYFISDGNGYMYVVEATKLADCETDIFTMVEDILANGTVKED